MKYLHFCLIIGGKKNGEILGPLAFSSAIGYEQHLLYGNSAAFLSKGENGNMLLLITFLMVEPILWADAVVFLCRRALL